MAFSDVSGVSNYFSNANEGFNTTTTGLVVAGANIVPLLSVTGLTNGSIFVGVIESGLAGEQIFTGTVDTSGLRITGVVWTKGTNIDHPSGSTVVDYDTGTHHNMLSKGVLVQHKQSGAHADTITTDTINENTASHGVTVAGLSIKSGVLQTATSVTKSNLEKPHFGALLMSIDSGTVFNNTQVTCVYDAAYSGNTGITADTTAHTLTIARDGLYQINMHFKCIDVAATDFITWLVVNSVAWRRQDQGIGVGQGDTWSFTLPLKAGDVVSQQVYNGGGATRFGYQNVGGSSSEFLRLASMSLVVAEIR